MIFPVDNYSNNMIF